jgi:AAA family ATP:ADP antiporter
MSGNGETAELSPLERFLSLFAKMEPGEGLACILNFVNIFLILASYYVMKVVRDGLIVGGKKWFGLSGAEVKIYAAAAMAFLLLLVVPLYGHVASKVSRIKLINSCYAIVVGCLALFFVLGNAGMNLGLVFFLWIGIVNVFLISQFWQFANDIYSKAQGERLFAVIAIGGSLGAILGPLLAKLHDNVYVLMGVAGGILLACLFLFNTVNTMQAKRAAAADDGDDEPGEEVKKQLKNTMAASSKDMKEELKKFAEEEKAKQEKKDAKKDSGEEPLGKDGGFQLLWDQKYLLFIGLMVLVANLVNTTGEYILGDAAETYAAEQAPVPADVQTQLDAFPKDSKDPAVEEQKEAIMKPINDKRSAAAKNFYSDFFLFVNIFGLLIQSFIVSRVFKMFGVRAALYVLPVIALGGYAAIGLLGGLTVLRVAKTAENSTDYSLQNTVKQALFLPTSREAKYKAKAAIDTFMVRIGDALAAATVAIGLHTFGFDAKSFAFTNLVFIGLWLFFNTRIAKGHKELAGEEEAEKAAA